ncbi:MAG: hypothetical protein ACTH1Z_10230 [Ancrocorticia sp.]|uniref:hypothetical protein n=1 Tax=Ancrocorticia sp. TaxID=2593684 RepID=UPI003F935557
MNSTVVAALLADTRGDLYETAGVPPIREIIAVEELKVLLEDRAVVDHIGKLYVNLGPVDGFKEAWKVTKERLNGCSTISVSLFGWCGNRRNDEYPGGEKNAAQGVIKV